MALYYENLDDRTRQFMVDEVDLDVSTGNIYMSPRLTEEGKSNYVDILKDAIRNGSDNSLAVQLKGHGYINAFEQRRKSSGGFSTVKIPVTAAETLSEGEFNRYYMRGLCRRAIDDGIAEVEVYRGKAVSKPRPESVAMIGNRLPVKKLLDDLRQSSGVETALGIPPGPNSGLTTRLPG